MAHEKSQDDLDFDAEMDAGTLERAKEIEMDSDRFKRAQAALEKKLEAVEAVVKENRKNPLLGAKKKPLLTNED